MNLPKYSIGHILINSDALYEQLKHFAGLPIVGEKYNEFCKTVYSHFIKATDYTCAEASCRAVIGRTLTDKDINLFSWRLCGNIEDLKNFRPVRQWSGQYHDEWMPLEIVDVVATQSAKPSYMFTFRILAGSGSALLCKKVWTKRFCYFVSRQFGFTRSDKKYPLKIVNQFVGMRLFGEFLAGQSTADSGPVFDKVHVSSGMLGFNKILLAKRAKNYPGFHCPLGHKYDCVMCHIGYDSCELATHPRTYTHRFCEFCEEMSWFDPKTVSRKCVNCQNSKTSKKV